MVSEPVVPEPVVPAGNIAIDGDRMWATIMETAQIGATPKGGIRRLTLTDLDRQVRDWFRAVVQGRRMHGVGGRHGQYFCAPGRA